MKAIYCHNSWISLLWFRALDENSRKVCVVKRILCWERYYLLLTVYILLFIYISPRVHLASVGCEMYVLKVLVSLRKLSRWCVRSPTDTHAQHHRERAREYGGSRPILLSIVSSAASLSLCPPPPISRCCYMYYLYACPSLDTDASCFAILNRSNQQCVKQEWIFYALGVRTSKSLL